MLAFMKKHSKSGAIRPQLEMLNLKIFRILVYLE